jgi:hypothetical protein
MHHPSILLNDEEIYVGGMAAASAPPDKRAADRVKRAVQRRSNPAPNKESLLGLLRLKREKILYFACEKWPPCGMGPQRSAFGRFIEFVNCLAILHSFW